MMRSGGNWGIEYLARRVTGVRKCLGEFNCQWGGGCGRLHRVHFA